MAEIFALQGTCNSGKSSTIRLVYNTLTNKYPAAHVQNLSPNTKDIKIIISGIKGLVIGIESQGDPNSRLLKSLQDFSNANCDIIICAARTSGMTVAWVNAYSGQYRVHFIPQVLAIPSNQAASNLAMALSIITQAGL
jgi:hypothetical protein